MVMSTNALRSASRAAGRRLHNALTGFRSKKNIPTTTSSLSSQKKRYYSASPNDDNSDHREKDLEDKLAAKLRYDLAVAHRLTAQHSMDMLVWNHISARFKDGCLITPGRMMWNDVKPEDLVFSSDNITADIIHAAIYEASPDIQAVMHLHTPAATAVSCLKEGFIPMTQDSAYFYDKVVHYEWDGVSDDVAEGPAITAAVKEATKKNANTILFENHGFVCYGKSVPEVWILCYYFERACEVQLRVMQSGGTPRMPNPKIMKQAAETSYLPEFYPGECEWEALSKQVQF